MVMRPETEPQTSDEKGERGQQGWSKWRLLEDTDVTWPGVS